MKLQKRINNDYLTIPTGILQIIKEESISMENKSTALYNYFNEMTSETQITTHDKVWLMLIANWTPPNTGMNMMDVARWFDITRKIDEIDETATDIEFAISPKEAKMIFEKLRNPEFKISKVTSSLQYFLNDLQESTNMSLLSKDDNDKDKK